MTSRRGRRATTPKARTNKNNNESETDSNNPCLKCDSVHKCSCDSASNYLHDLKKKTIQYEIENIAMSKINIQSARDNIILHTQNLHLLHENLTKEIEALKQKSIPNTSNATEPLDNSTRTRLDIEEVSTTTTVTNQYDTASVEKNIKTEIPDNDLFSTENVKIENLSDIPDNESLKMEINKVENLPEASKPDKDVLMPYVILKVSTSNCGDKRNRPTIYIKMIEDIEINEYFEIVSDNPFVIQPINKDIPMKYVDLQKIGNICSQKKKEISEGILQISIVSKTDVAHVANNIRDSNRISLKNVSCNENIKNQIRSHIADKNTGKKNVVDLTETEIDDEVVFFSNSPETSTSTPNAKRKAESDNTPKKNLKKTHSTSDHDNNDSNDVEITLPNEEVIEIN